MPPPVLILVFLERIPIEKEGCGMADKEALSNEQKRRNVVEKMWLNYFNDQLYERGMITDTQHRQMKIQISGRRPSIQR